MDLQQIGSGAWTGLIWLRIETSCGLLQIWLWTSWFYNMWGISWLAVELLASKDGLCCMELVSLILGCRRDVDDFCTLLGCYAASCGNSLPTFRDNVLVPFASPSRNSYSDSWSVKIGPIHCPETSVNITTRRSVTSQKSADLMELLVYLFIYLLFLHTNSPTTGILVKK
jgi:hypothetical protein